MLGCAGTLGQQEGLCAPVKAGHSPHSLTCGVCAPMGTGMQLLLARGGTPSSNFGWGISASPDPGAL